MNINSWSAILVGFFLGALPLMSVSAQTNAGNVDSNFSPATNDAVSSVVVQPDGRIVVGGSFTQIDGTIQNNVARLNPDGTLDGSFQAVTNGAVSVLALQADGKILLAGSFSQVNGTAVQGLARLNSDGTSDANFLAPATVAGWTITALLVQSDNRILVGGGVTSQPFPIVARLNADGTLDSGFSATLVGYDSGSGYLSTVRTLALQTDGKVIVGGIFNQVGGTERDGLARLNTDGTLDGSFDSGGIFATLRSGVNSPLIASVTVESDGKIIVGGLFAVNNQGNVKTSLARLNADGSLDTGFGATADNAVYGVTIQSDQKVLINGIFSKVGGMSHPTLMRLNTDGSLDTGFDPGTGPTVTTPNATTGTVATLGVQADGNIVIGGRFDAFNGTQRENLARLLGVTAHPPFFNGEVVLGQGIYYLAFPNNTPFGYYAYLSDAHYIYHFDLGYEYWFDAADGGGIYFYDFGSGHFLYTSPTLPFPYLYDFSLQAFLYYYPDPNNPQRYNTDGVRYFYNFGTGRIISM